VFGVFCFQARPDPVRRVPLFAGCLRIELPQLLDPILSLVFSAPAESPR
jgi:hypothetical protein